MHRVEDWSHAAEFAADPASVRMTRLWVSQRLLDHDLAYLVDDLQLVVSELATNAMMHAETPFVVTLRAFKASVRLEVLDGVQSGPVRRTAQILETSGRGVAIVDTLSRAWGVTGNPSGGKSVWAEFNRVEEGQESAMNR